MILREAFLGKNPINRVNAYTLVRQRQFGFSCYVIEELYGVRECKAV